MSGLLFLTYKDFNIQQGNTGKFLINNIPGFSFILFYSTQCSHCKRLIPLFKQLPSAVNGCKFGMINVSKNKQIVNMSKNTVAPITYVPYLILYINGRPFMRYDGPHKMNEVRRFIFEVHNKVKHKQQFSKETKTNNVEKQPVKKSIPAYTIGNPKCGKDDVCYLEFISAYNKK